MSTDPQRGRARLWLRAERAFGLQSLQTPNPPPPGNETDSEANEADVPAPSHSIAAPALFQSPPAAGASSFSSGAFSLSVLSPDEKKQKLFELNATEVSICRKCR